MSLRGKACPSTGASAKQNLQSCGRGKPDHLEMQEESNDTGGDEQDNSSENGEDL